MPSEKGLDESFLLVLPDLHLGSFLKCDLLPRTGSGRTRHHPSRACCRWQMAPRHPATRFFDSRASDRAAELPSDGDSWPSSRCGSSSLTRLSLAAAPLMDATTPSTSCKVMGGRYPLLCNGIYPAIGMRLQPIPSPGYK